MNMFSFFSKSKSHCDWRSVSQSVSKSWCRASSGAHDQIFITVWQLRSCFLWGDMLLTLASAVFLGSEPLGTRDHILLSQIWDNFFHRLLRLAGSRWRYSIPPPHGHFFLFIPTFLSYDTDRRENASNNYSIVAYILRRRKVYTGPLPSNDRGIHTQTHRLIYEVAAEMGSGTMIYIPSFIKIGYGIQKFTHTDVQTHTRTERWSQKSILFFSKQGNRPKH
jgi:hypothetical protein